MLKDHSLGTFDAVAGMTADQQRELLATFDERLALVVGFVDAAGEPVGTRGWGATFDADAGRGRVLVPAAELRSAGLDVGDGGGRRIAVNYVDIATLRCLQVKGDLHAIEEATEADAALYAQFRDAFFTAANQVDLMSFELLARMEPDAVLACTFSVDSFFDQTPGPGAGRAIGNA